MRIKTAQYTENAFDIFRILSYIYSRGFRMGKIARPKGTDVMVQSNKVTHYRGSLTLLQEKLFTLFYSKIGKNQADFPVLTFSVTEICHALETRPEDMRPALKRMQERTLEIGDINNLNETYTSYSPITRFTHSPDTKTVTIKLNEELKPFFLGLAEEFTMIEAEKTYRLHSSYSIRIFRYICQWRSKIEDPKVKVFPVTLDYQEMREEFKLGDKWKKTHDFKRYILKPAVEDINQADIGYHVEMGEPYKVGRNIFDFILNVSVVKPGETKKAAKAKSTRQVTAEEKERDDKSAFIDEHQEEFYKILSEIKAQPELDGMPDSIRGNPYKIEAYQFDEAYRTLCKRYPKKASK